MGNTTNITNLVHEIDLAVERSKLLIKVYWTMRGAKERRKKECKSLFLKVAAWFLSNSAWIEAFNRETPITLEMLDGLREVQPLLEDVFLWASPYERKLGDEIDSQLRRVCKFDDSE